MASSAILLVFVAVFFIALGVILLLESGKGEKKLRERVKEIGGGGSPAARRDLDLIRHRRYSDIAPLEKLLSAGRMGAAISLFLAQANVSLSVGSFVLLTLTLAFAGLLVGSHVSRLPIAGPFLFFALGIIPYLVIAQRRRKRFQKFTEQFPDALELIANALRAGMALSGALRIVAHEMPDPVGGEFWVTTEEHNLGLDIKEALFRMNRRMDISDVRFFVTAVVLQRETGGNLAEILDNTTSIIRDRFRILSEARVLSAQGRLSGVALVFLPIVMTIVLSIIAPGYLSILTSDPVGKYMLGTCLVLMVIGIFAIRKIVRIKV
ncbi:MAG: type II secretion system F family protein [Candidatus Eisenbacteria bacterium]